MKIKLGKYLLELKRSETSGEDKLSGSIDGNSLTDIDKAGQKISKNPEDIDKAGQNTTKNPTDISKSPKDAGKNPAITDKSLPGTGNADSGTGFNAGDINTIEFVSHELKGVLGSTILCVYSIRDGLLGMLNFKQRASIETTIRNLRRLESTIKDFLDISRLEDGQLKIRKSSIKVTEDIINEVEDAFLTEIYENRVVFENRIPKDLVIVSDRTLLMTIFNNLVSNAIKYGIKGGSIVISTKEAKEAPGNLISFSVYNDGIPITQQDKEKLFKKFSRLEKEHDRKIKGTGLGLFIIKDIIENLGGSIRVETNDNGNEFIFEIERV
jgi:two-component system phosphate regulon sensor histidine kinase PhoR